MHALEHWHDFYVLLGTAGATLLALLFVAVSLGAGFLTDADGARRAPFTARWWCISPQRVFHRAIALVPAHRIVFFAALIGACA